MDPLSHVFFNETLGKRDTWYCTIVNLSINSAYLAIRFDDLAVVPPLGGGSSLWLRLHTSGIEPECMKLILGLVFQIGGLGVLARRVTPQHDTCHPQLRPSLLTSTPTSLASLDGSLKISPRHLTHNVLIYFGRVIQSNILATNGVTL